MATILSTNSQSLHIMFTDEESLQRECANLESQLVDLQENSDFLNALVEHQKQKLTSIKSNLADGRVELTRYLERQGGSSSLEFEQEKLALIDHSEAQLEQTLIKDVDALRRRFPAENFNIPNIQTTDDITACLGPIVEDAIHNAMAQEKEALNKKRILDEKIKRNEILKEQIRQLEESVFSLNRTD